MEKINFIVGLLIALSKTAATKDIVYFFINTFKKQHNEQ
jgi:hypothetical protein